MDRGNEGVLNMISHRGQFETAGTTMAPFSAILFCSAIIFCLTLPVSAGWSEDMAKAVERGSHQEIRETLLSRSTGNPLEFDFVNAVIAWEELGIPRDISEILERNFKGPLTSNFGKDSPLAYTS